MYSSPRPGTPYIVFSPKVKDDYFEDNGRQLSSPLQSSLLQSSLKGSKDRPATPYTPSLCGREDLDNIDSAGYSVKCDKYGLGLGIAPILAGRHASGEQSRRSSGNLSSRRPSLQIARMPSTGLHESSLPTGTSSSSSGSSSNGASDATLTAFRSFSVSSVRGPGQARFDVDDDEGSDGDGTPRVNSFAAAMSNSQRKATPYPSSKRAYFEEGEDDGEDEDLQESFSGGGEGEAETLVEFSGFQPV